MRGSMLSCAAGVRRTVQLTTRSRPLPTSSALAPLTSRLPPADRWFATETAVAGSDAPQQLTLSPAGGKEDEAKRIAKMERTVNKSLSYLKDAWTVAQRVEETLAKDRFDEALLLTQKASKSLQTTVSWNHLIGYQMKKQQLRSAIKLYNEMKKRAQLPNVQTYTIIFRGCAASNHPKQAVAEAMKHYNILLNDSRLSPNTTHLNAVLNVCARAGDLDSMFLMTKSINEGNRAPTTWTYTIILNALRNHVQTDVGTLPVEHHAANIEKTIGRAKSIWNEVIEQWRAGKLMIDEELVCAMGRVLLLAQGREQRKEILDLLQQTMNIPNLAKGVSAKRSKSDNSSKAAASSAAAAVSGSRALYAKPGQNTLGLLLKALTASRMTSVGTDYWDLLVRHSEVAVVPDQDNWHRMFGMLKVAKASADVAGLINSIPDEHLSPLPYQISMDACVRDNINPNVIKNATVVLDSMMKRLPLPDLYTLRQYLRVALCSHFHFRAAAREGALEEAKRKYGLQITAALDRLWEPYKQLHYQYFKATTPSNHKQSMAQYNSQREVIALARLMFSAFNKVINEKMLPDGELRNLRVVGAKINREIVKFYSDREAMEPKLRNPDAHAAGATDGGDPDGVAAKIRNIDGGTSKESDATDINEMDNPERARTADFVWDTTQPVRPSTSRRKRG